MKTHPLLPLLSLLALVPALACGGGDGTDAGPDAGDACSSVFYADSDGDGFGDDNASTSACEAPTGYVAQKGDCDDEDPLAHPGLPEICDGRDNDCNGKTDSQDPNINLSTQRLYFLDSDGDGYGTSATTMTSCDKPSGYSINDEDCDDSRAQIHPGQTEICDGFDNDCDSLYDDDDDSLDSSTATSYYSDSDGDGYGVGNALVACNAPLAHATQAGDCDDGQASVHPGESEICDGLDNDCDGNTDSVGGGASQCSSFAGSYTGSYALRAQEKLGNAVINDMPCNGTASITINLAASPSVQGTVSCQRVGGLILFDANQSGTITGELGLDGSVSGTLVHRYNSDLVRSYNFNAQLSGDTLNIAGTGSLLPHPMSAVPWEVTYNMQTSR